MKFEYAPAAFHSAAARPSESHTICPARIVITHRRSVACGHAGSICSASSAGSGYFDTQTPKKNVLAAG